MQLGWLRTFIAVYHTGSFTKAARQLGITQPAVTQQIRGLEAELGTPLFDRTPQGAVPTVEARALAHDVESSITLLDAAISRHFESGPSDRPLRLGGPAELVTTRVLPSIGCLISSSIDLRVTLGEATELLAGLKNGHLDIVVSTIPPRERGVDATPLTDEEFALVAAPQIASGLPLERLRAQGPEVLEKVPLVSYAETLPIIRRYWRSVFDAPPPGSPAIVVRDLRGVISAVIAGAGISVVPTYLCQDSLASGALVPLLEPEIPPINTFYLASRSGALSDPRLALLHGHLVEEARGWTAARPAKPEVATVISRGVRGSTRRLRR